MNWFRRYIYSQGLAPYLQQLGVRPEVQQFITKLPREKAQHFVNFVRSNPKVDLPSLQNQIQLPQKKEAEYFPDERAIASRFSGQTQILHPNIPRWILVNFRKARKGRQDLTYHEIHSTNIFPEYNQFISMLLDWDVTNGLTDFLYNNPNFRLDSYTPNQVYNIVEEWHSTQAGKGKGKIYGPIEQSLIVYGPQWKNNNISIYYKEWQGWTIQEVRTENDLAVEGNLMNNCVGSYFEAVEEGKCRIFSLRDPQNKPHVTIETDNSIHDFRQILGNSNREPDKTYKKMIKEWITSLPGDRYFAGEDRDNLYYPLHYLDMDKINNVLAKTVDPEYGLKSNSNVEVPDFERIIGDYIARDNSGSEGNYRGAVEDFPELFINALLTEKGVNIIPIFEEALYEYEEKANEHLDLDYPMVNSPPEEEDFETDQEYQKAYDAWQEQEQKYQDEAIMEDRKRYLPWAAIDDAFRYINKLREKKVIP